MKQFIFTAELIEEDDGGFSVYCPELGVASQGDNEDDALANIREAVELHLETIKEIGGSAKLPRIIRKEIEVSIDV